MRQLTHLYAIALLLIISLAKKEKGHTPIFLNLHDAFNLGPDRLKDAKHLKAIALARYAAHPPMQHMDECIVKIASRMSRTGKTDRTVNFYLIGSNG